MPNTNSLYSPWSAQDELHTSSMSEAKNGNKYLSISENRINGTRRNGHCTSLSANRFRSSRKPIEDAAPPSPLRPGMVVGIPVGPRGGRPTV